MRDDDVLVQRMRRGDQRAFDQFFAENAQRLARFARRRSALNDAAIEDVVQHTMIKAVGNLESFRGQATLFTWLCGICRNHMVDQHRQRARRPVERSLDDQGPRQGEAVPAALIDAADPLELCELDSHRSRVRAAVNRLPGRFSRVLELRFGEEMTVPEIASHLGLSDDAAESLLSRARRAFHDLWSADESAGDASPAGRQL